MSDKPLWKVNPRLWAEKMATCAQRARSIMRESLENDEEFLALLDPWLFGKKSIMPVLLKIAQFPEIAEGDVLNLAYVLSKCPALTMQMASLGVDVPTPEEVLHWIGESRKVK